MKYIAIFFIWLLSLVAIAQIAIWQTREVVEYEMHKRLAEKCSLTVSDIQQH